MDQSLRKNPLWLIWLLSSHLKHYIAEFSEQNHLTPSQFHALLLLEPEGGATMRQLSCLLSCDPSYVTSIVDGLEALKLVHRQDSPTDRRTKTLMLSPAGIELRTSLVDTFQDYYEQLELAEHFGPATVDELSDLTTATFRLSRKKSEQTKKS